MSDPAARNLSEVFVHLSDAAAATSIPVGADFWTEVVGTLPPGRLVCRMGMSDDWPIWERHPAGDEVVVALTGCFDFILEIDGAERRTRLPAGAFVIVPQGIWHTATVVEPGEALFITRGDGTEHRPV